MTSPGTQASTDITTRSDNGDANETVLAVGKRVSFAQVDILSEVNL